MELLEEFIREFLFYDFSSEIIENQNNLGCLSRSWSVKINSNKKFFIKHSPHHASLKKFHNLETYFYTKILPAFSFKSLFPKFFFANKNFIAMEDLTDDWININPSRGFSFSEMKIALDTLACFHSEGYNIRVKNNNALIRNIFPEILDVKKQNTTKEIENNPYFQKEFQRVVSVISDKKIILSILSLEKKAKYYVPWLLNQIDKFSESETLLHNDSHKNNFLFRNNQSKLLDFQMITNGHPSRDVMMFLLSSLDDINYFNDLIDYYLKRLKFYCTNSHSSELQNFFQKTISNWKNVCIYSIILAIITIILSAQNLFIKYGSIKRLENILKYTVDRLWI
jgi:hypothetical protein